MQRSVMIKLFQGTKFLLLHALLFATVQNPGSIAKSTETVNIGRLQVKALFDSSSTESFIHPSLVERAGRQYNLPMGLSLWLPRPYQPMLLVCEKKVT